MKKIIIHPFTSCEMQLVETAIDILYSTPISSWWVWLYAILLFATSFCDVIESLPTKRKAHHHHDVGCSREVWYQGCPPRIGRPSKSEWYQGRVSPTRLRVSAILETPKKKTLSSFRRTGHKERSIPTRQKTDADESKKTRG